MSPRPKRWLARLKICPHGGIDHAELKALGIKPEEVLDFSVSTNPFMPPPGLRESLGSAAIEQYPDSEAAQLKRKISGVLRVPSENILVGNGTTELIRLIATAYFRRGNPVLLIEPTYGEYEVASRIAGARLIRHHAGASDGFLPRIEEVMKLIRKSRPRAVFLCNPNNPTGKYLTRKSVEDVLGALGEGLLILDEAYASFVDTKWDSTALITGGKAVILRSMTKDYGLPGLRLGYALAHEGITEDLRRVCPPWNVNAVAQQAGLAVLEDREYFEQTLIKINEAKNYLTSKLARLGLKVLPSDANYFLMQVDSATEFRRSLLGYGILVRDCTSFGLPEHVRIAPRTMPECERLVNAVKSLKSRKGQK